MIGNEDSASLFVCRNWVCNYKEFKNTILSIWGNWEDKGFPIGIPRNVLAER